MEEKLISVIDAAKQVGLRKSRIFKIINKLKITLVKQKSSEAKSKGQTIAYLSFVDFEQIKESLGSGTGTGVMSPSDLPQVEGVGLFYLIQLEPVHDPERFKVGFASNIRERIRSLKTSAPYLQLFKSWPCKLLWEKTAIDCVCQGCEKIHTEVFRAKSIQEVSERCGMFFELMPKLKNSN